MAGIVCARTLAQAGRRVTLFDKSRRPGGRMATRESPFGSFDHGAQYFTVRDKRFQQALDTVPGIHRPWSATSVRVLDPLGHVLEAGLPGGEPHWVGVPGMRSLPEAWAAGLEPRSGGLWAAGAAHGAQQQATRRLAAAHPGHRGRGARAHGV